ncbi:MAG: hypothetical protein WAZ99_05840 [Rectinemataceae bacterium]
MKFDDLLRFFADKAWFDFEMVLLLSGEEPASVHTELYRWRQSGKVLELRRGLFTLAEPWRHARLDGSGLAGPLYPPSYLSGRWLLARRGVLATGTPQSGAAGATATAGSGAEYTSVTARPAKVFENVFGRYAYATLPRDLLFGSASDDIGGIRVRVALPEKALLDFCFVEGGEWDEKRFEAAGMNPAPPAPDQFGLKQLDRKQFDSNQPDIQQLDLVRLEGLAARTGRPRLVRAAGAFLRYAKRRGALSLAGTGL